MSAEYGLASRILHRLALGSRAIAETSFDVGQAAVRSDLEGVTEGRHVFVAGLARSGTTILLRRLHATGAFRSLTYRDMPFVLMPNTWRRLSARIRRELPPHERPHGDGIQVDLDSPEALEDVFWRVFAGDRYIHGDRLAPMASDPELVRRFRRYVAAVLDGPGRNGPKRYLSKNNNNILRLGSLREAFPRAHLVIPFRDPLQQAASLMAQHRRFRAEDARDAFTRRYMRWLGHHEFGADHRRFRFRPSAPVYTDPDSLDYWVELWVEAYDWLLETRPEGARFLDHDRFADDPETEWPRLAARLGIPEDLPDGEPIVRRTRDVVDPVDGGLMERAAAVHGRLRGAPSATG